MFDMMKMMGKVKEVQDRVREAQDRLGNITVEGESGAGMVKVVANCKKQIVKLDIDDSLTGAESKTILSDLIVAAVNNAMDKADETAREEIKKSTEGMMPNIPGMDLSNMFGG
ncbi:MULTISPECIES: YbaB/EbfC family nucleoid-associated protein [Persicobacter]|uniref:Nucleoid-associated protein PEDI_04050 n=1 Tax=Persicobacter diffluens TaxID=981 RepID=A0AAN4VVT1_9BACT|nr:YbaB/EbfC family nucleoid-associated protein [Persicobacter sp. CCB-QB2]GJM59853.1 nucleoid-associated protein YbaB [Persicobacter diffluens]